MSEHGENPTKDIEEPEVHDEVLTEEVAAPAPVRRRKTARGNNALPLGWLLLVILVLYLLSHQ